MTPAAGGGASWSSFGVEATPSRRSTDMLQLLEGAGPAGSWLPQRGEHQRAASRYHWQSDADWLTGCVFKCGGPPRKVGGLPAAFALRCSGGFRSLPRPRRLRAS